MTAPGAGAVRFEPVGEKHWPLLGRWLAEPHVRQWWGEPSEELALIRALPDADGTEGFVAALDGEPVAFIQSWRPARFTNTHWVEEAPWLRDLAPDTVGIDVFVGPAERIGAGIGPRVVRAFAARLFSAGAPRLLIDPDKSNARAVRAYAKAGFRAYSEWTDAAGETTVLMELLPADLILRRSPDGRASEAAS